MNRLLPLFLLLLSALWPWHAFASPWTLPEGEAVLQLSMIGQRSAQHFTYDQGLEPYPWGGEQRSMDYALGVRYGVSPKLEIGGNIFYKTLAYTSNTLCIDVGAEVDSAEAYQCPNPYTDPQAYEALSVLDLDVNLQGFADAWLYTKLKVLEGPVVIALAPTLKIPLGYEGPSALFSGGTDDVTLGGGQIDLGGYAHFGLSLPTQNTFIKADIGYLHRFGSPGDQLILGGKIGYKLGNRSFLAAGLESTLTVTPGESIGLQGIRVESDGTIVVSEISNESDQLRGELCLIHRPQADIEVVAALFQILHGQYVAASTGFSVGTLIHF